MNLPAPEISVDWGVPIKDLAKSATPATTFYEKKIGNTLYRVTAVYKGEIDFVKALENLIIKRVLRELQEEGLINSTE